MLVSISWIYILFPLSCQINGYVRFFCFFSVYINESSIPTRVKRKRNWNAYIAVEWQTFFGTQHLHFDGRRKKISVFIAEFSSFCFTWKLYWSNCKYCDDWNELPLHMTFWLIIAQFLLCTREDFKKNSMYDSMHTHAEVILANVSESYVTCKLGFVWKIEIPEEPYWNFQQFHWTFQYSLYSSIDNEAKSTRLMCFVNNKNHLICWSFVVTQSMCTLSYNSATVLLKKL